MKFMLIRLVMAAIFILCAYKWGDWKNWRKYYPTMLFFGMGALIYTVTFHTKPLWQFQTDFLVPALNELFVIFTIFFSTALLFLSNLKKKLIPQIVYILLWIALYMSIELFTTSIGMQKNSNGWTIWWSLLFNIIMFPLLILHHKKPLFAWILSFIFLASIMKIFSMPFIVSIYLNLVFYMSEMLILERLHFLILA
jgi:hypothetical protein